MVKFIADKEIEDLYKEDLLETKKYANTLKDIIENSNGPLTIGIFGEWGSGKSSIINTVKKNINDIKTKFIVYDAWKYHGDSFRRMFLRELANQLNIRMQDNFENFYIDKNETVKINKKINWWFFAILFLGVFILIDIDILDLKKDILLVFAATIIGIIGKDLFDSYNVTVNKTKLFAPEQFEEIYHEIVDSIFKPNFNPIKWVKEKIKGKIEKIVIVIDNLDRCDDNTIYELLTTIKTFLQKENIIFIIPIDDLRLKKFLAKNHKLNEKEVDEFLRKIFDVTLKIKHFQPLDMFYYTNRLNEKHQLNLKPDTIDIFAKECATNPRRIIQLINNLLIEKDILKNKYNEHFIDIYEGVIAKLLIIREEWPKFYKKLQENPNLINNIDNEENKEKNNNENNELKNFLKRTKGYTVNIDARVIEKIISNIDNDFDIDSLMIKNLINHNYDSIEEEQIDDKLLNFIFDELSKEIKNKTFKGGALNRFKNLIKLNSMKELPLNFIKRFDSDFEVNEILQIIENLSRDNFDDLFKFVNLLHKNSFNELLDKIVKKYQEIWENKKEKDEVEKLPEIWNYGLDYLINNIDAESIIKTLQKSFINFYDYYSESPLYKKSWIDENKLKFILSQELINYLIEKVDEEFENDAFKELVFFAEKELLDIGKIEKLFEKLNWCKNDNFQNQNDARDKCILDLINKIKNLNELLMLLFPIKYKSEIIQKKLINLQTISKKYKPGYNIKIDLLNDINNYKETRDELLKFYLNIYKDTNNHTDVLSYIKNLINKYQELKEILYSSLIKLHKQFNFTLQPFVDYLLSQKELNNNLLKIYLSYISNEDILKKYIEQIKNKLIELLKQYNDEIKWFFDEILDKEILKDALIELLENDFESFDKLPITFKKLAFNFICKNSLINEFEDDIEILKELAKENYSQCIKNILIKKLGEEKIDEVLDILNSFEKIDKQLWKNLKSLLEEYKEEYEDQISEIENKVENV